MLFRTFGEAAPWNEARVDDMGFRDAKGRVIGYRFHLFVDRDGGWRLQPHQMRNGRDFGAWHYGFKFGTKEEAEAYAIVAFERREKAYGRLFAKAP